MPRVMRRMTVLSAVITAAAGLLFCRWTRGILLTLAVTFGTVTYHLGIRLLVGAAFNRIMRNRANCSAWWFRTRPWEARFHRRWRVKDWKDKMPTYEPESFSLERHTLEEIAQAMCQSELVHETNMVLSFLPLLAARWFGDLYVFLITSICAALFDGAFVIIQRYNRARIGKILAKRGTSAALPQGRPKP